MFESNAKKKNYSFQNSNIVFKAQTNSFGFGLSENVINKSRSSVTSQHQVFYEPAHPYIAHGNSLFIFINNW